MNKKNHKEEMENIQFEENKDIDMENGVNGETTEGETEQAGRSEDSKEAVQELGEKLSELEDKYKRLYAEFDNYRRRTAKEKADLMLYAAEATIKDILPVIDDYERALADMESSEDMTSERKEGIQLIYNKLMGILEKKGVKPMDAKGQLFDENLHEAVSHFPKSEEMKKGQIIDEIQKGYFMHERVIRFAKVVVAM